MSDQPRNYRIIALVVAFALFMQQLDATVLTIALPAMARDLEVTASSLSLALTAYLVSLAVFIPASGRLADRFGSRTVFCGAIAVFMAGSIACAQSTSLVMLVAARFIQGLGGAMMVPVGRLVLLRSVARQDLVAALSWLVMPALVGPIVGPPVGGLIVTYLDWRWIFYINIPIGMVGLVLSLLLIPQVKDDAPGRFDGKGFLLSGMALGCLIFGFELASRPLSVLVIVLLLGSGAVLAFAYLHHARRISDPILDLSLLGIPTFGLSVAAGNLARITQGAQPFLLPLLFQIGLGLSAATTGTIMMASAVGALAMKPIAPAIIRRFGYRDSLTAATIAASIGYASCAFFRPDWPLAAIVAILVASGFFMSFLFTAYNAVAFVDVEQSRMSAATSLYGTFQQLSLSLGICVAAAALELGTRPFDTYAGFMIAFLLVSAISAGATILNRGFAADAGL
ncbi:MFS transporter [Sphingobium sp. BYY-5]|uniref:MFS transporter n=1 Tax=Sphingobium sp. BYY-5 TaxID=2926400 RepID=UPI001FA7DD26|nr:MFS transporter [Sphingobium sp. BYY-5]MCI4592554.1 MFS transporter [Sphingobium sp. BYY-5]